MSRIPLSFVAFSLGLFAHAQVSLAQTTALTRASRFTNSADLNDEFDAIVKAAGLTPLRSQVLPQGEREIRIWIGGGIGYPQDLYRIIDRRGKISGQLFFYWPSYPPDTSQGERTGESFSDIVVFHQRGRCDRFRYADNIGVCVARFTRQPNWPTILRQAEAAGLWSLPDESTLPRDNIITLDGWGITVELRDGSAYRQYEYSNPDAHKQWPEAKRAVAIAAAIGAVGSFVAPSEAERTYRGLYRSGPNLSEFIACGSKEKWGFQGDLGSTSGWSNRPRADTAITGVRSQYVEVRGSLTPVWLAKKWRSEYSRVLEVSQISSTKPWSSSACQ